VLFAWIANEVGLYRQAWNSVQSHLEILSSRGEGCGVFSAERIKALHKAAQDAGNALEKDTVIRELLEIPTDKRPHQEQRSQAAERR